MPILLISLTITMTLGAGLAYGALTDSSHFFQALCLQGIPLESQHHEIYSALLCGQRVPQNSEPQRLVRPLGLIHILVVSGAHLIWVDSLLRQVSRLLPLKSQTTFRVMALALVTLSCGLQAPVLRSTFSLCLWQMQKYLCLNWTPGQKVALSALCSLLFLHQGLQSLSLKLSWTAALALNLPLKKPHRKLKQSGLVYVFLCPLLAPYFPIPHPLSILINALLAEGLLKLWLSLSLLQALLPFPLTRWLGDQTMTLSFFLLNRLGQLIPAPSAFDQQISRSLKGLDWLYIGSLQCFVLIKETLSNQRRRPKPKNDSSQFNA